MEIERWRPKRELSEQEERIIERMKSTGKLFAFLRRHRHELFDEAFQAELETMYRQTGAGKEPLPPARMAMATLLQGYLGASDATMVELTVFDLRVQMVLDCLGHSEPAFSKGALCDFRHRLIGANMDRRLLEKSVEVAMGQQEFGWRALKSSLRVAIDSRPLEGAGRVEDTFNLLGHAARKVVACVAGMLECSTDRVCREAGIPLLLESSVKKALDVDWNEAGQRAGRFKSSSSNWTVWCNGCGGSCPSSSCRSRWRGTSRRLSNCAARTWSRTRTEEEYASARPWRRTGACRWKTAKCVTAARARASASTASNSTSPRRWNWTSSWRVPSPQPIAPRQRRPRRCEKTCNGKEYGLGSCTSTVGTSTAP